MPEGEKYTGTSSSDLDGGFGGSGLISPGVNRRQGGAVAKPANGAAADRFSIPMSASNRVVDRELEKVSRQGWAFTPEQAATLARMRPDLNLGGAPASEQEQDAARKAKIAALVRTAVDSGLIVPDEFLSEERIENKLGEVLEYEAARKLVQAQEQAALEAQAAARRVAYPGWRGARDLMQDMTQQAEPIIWDAVTGEVAQRAGHTARLLADGKGGKTSVGLEWCRSALTGEPWLSHFQVRPVQAGASVAFVDPELDSDAAWYLKAALGGLPHGVVADRLRRIDLIAAKAAGWTWASAADRDWLADQIAGCERLFADSILSWLPAGGRGEAAHSLDAVGEFLDQFKAFQRRAGVRDVLVGIHRAKSGSGSFGSIQWDAKFQALWSIQVEQDGTGARKLRGEPGRAGTKFREAEIVQEVGGRLVFRAADVVGQILDDARREEEALAPALTLFPGFMRERFWSRGETPGKDDALVAVSDALKASGGSGISKRHYSPFWTEVESRGLAVLTKVPGKNKIAVCGPDGV